jgi:hypothetical protein
LDFAYVCFGLDKEDISSIRPGKSIPLRPAAGPESPQGMLIQTNAQSIEEGLVAILGELISPNGR